jgi:hypothetical protein
METRVCEADLFGYSCNIYYSIRDGKIIEPHLKSSKIDIMELIHNCLELDDKMTLKDLKDELYNIAFYSYKNNIDSLHPEYIGEGNTGLDQINWENNLAWSLREKRITSCIFKYNTRLYKMDISESGKTIFPIT